jgi:hypothetical protein
MAKNFILISKRVSGTTLRCSEDGQEHQGALPTVSRRKFGNFYTFSSKQRNRKIQKLSDILLVMP